MSIATLMHSKLAASAGVGARVYPLQLPQHPTYEAITYQRISNSGQNGTSNLRESRWQVNSWSDTYAGAHDLALVVKGALEEWHDLSVTPGILQATVVNEIDDYEPDVDVYRCTVDIMLVTTGD